MNVLKSILIVVLVIISGCRSGDKKIVEKAQGISNSITRAERFTLVKRNGYTEVNIINPWQGANNVSQTYKLVKRGSEIPDGEDSSSIIFVPLKKIICMSTTHVAMISALGEEESIAGVSGTGFIYSRSISERVEKGLVEDVGYEESLNNELILKISPDLIMIYGIGSESAGYVAKIKELGINVVINADYLETEPLRKAEWIKLFGALYCKEAFAERIYETEVAEYTKIRSFISKNIIKRPKVLLGLPFKDAWYISPGNSFISRLIDDAGGEYLWADTKSSVSMPFGLENVYLRALSADYWLNTGTATTRNEILSIDERLGDLPCFKKENMFNNNKRITSKGGNDYWENGSLYPHMILKDIAAILHPELFSDNELIFYRKIY